MQTDFAPIGQMRASHSGDNSFWPSFTDIMMVITMIFLMATSLLVVRNWQLVAELQESVAAEQLAAQLIQSTSQENATLEERLANAEQSNSILRLRLLRKDEELQSANQQIRQRDASIADLQARNIEFERSLDQSVAAVAAANLEIEKVTGEFEMLENQVANLSQELTRQEDENQATRALLSSAEAEIAALTQSSQAQQQSIASLTEEKQLLAEEKRTLSEEKQLLTEDKQLLNREIADYNRQLLTLQGDYEVVKSKYDELIKPARSAKGKYIAEVYYVKSGEGKIIRYRQPGDSEFSNLSLAEVEQRLDRLKAEQGKDLYVKIIIPEDSGLSYSEAWDFMRNLLVKYDYYYQ